MEHNEIRYSELKLFLALAATGVAAALFHVHIPHTDILIDGRWTFGFMGFALLRRRWAALALAVLLSYPYGTPDIPLWAGFGGNMLYAVLSLAVIRPLSDWMHRRWGPGWLFGGGWLASVLLCYQAFITPVVCSVSALLHGRSLWAGLIDGWRTQPYLVESVLVALVSAVAMVAALSVAGNLAFALHKMAMAQKPVESRRSHRDIFQYSPISIWEEDFSNVYEEIQRLRGKGVEDFVHYFENNPEEVPRFASLIRIVDVNATSLNFFGAESKDEILSDLLAYFDEDSLSVFREELVALARGDSVFECEIPILHPSRGKIMLQLSLHIVPGFEEDWSRVLVSFFDISERKQAEEALARQLRFEQGIAETSKRLLNSENPESAVADALTPLLEVSEVSRVYIFENFDDPSDGLCMKQTHEVCAPGITPELDNPVLQHVVYAHGFERWRQVLSAGHAIRGHVSDFPDGERQILESQGILSILVLPLVVDRTWWGFVGFDETRQLRDWKDSEMALLATAAEMLGAYFTRTKVEKHLRDEREQLLSIFNSVDAAIYIADPKTHEILYVNRRLQEQLPADYLGAKCYKVLQNLDAPCPFCTNDIILQLKPESHHWEFYNKNLDRHYVLADRIIRWPDGRDVRFEIAIDITARIDAESERERLSNQLAQSQKMESVGRLAGGVAHDFNNMLNVILGHTELTLKDLPADSPQRDSLAEIRKAAERSANLTRQLLAFARKQTVAPKNLDLNETIASMIKMLERLIGEDIDLLWKPGKRLAQVRIDPGQVDQILANLAVNARDAIGHRNGKITIETSNVEINEEYCAANLGATPGRYVMLAASDDGCGMDEETCAQIFEPFFTTKSVGEGTGLGLATIYGIVKQNDGFVNVYSEPGKGTTFRIHLPALDAELRQPGGTQSTAAAPVGGHETILVVEDEAAILNLAQTMLERLGYTVLAASNPNEAIRTARERSDRIDLLITDVVMPEMNGRDLARSLQECCPQIRILFMSGYTASVIAQHNVLDDGVNFIEKPFSMRGLARKVRKALDT